MTRNEFKEQMQNGLGTKVATGVLISVISAACIGFWHLSMNVSGMTSELIEVNKRLDRFDGRFDSYNMRLTYIERKLSSKATPGFSAHSGTQPEHYRPNLNDGS